MRERILQYEDLIQQNRRTRGGGTKMRMTQGGRCLVILVEILSFIRNVSHPAVSALIYSTCLFSCARVFFSCCLCAVWHVIWYIPLVSSLFQCQEFSFSPYVQQQELFHYFSYFFPFFFFSRVSWVYVYVYVNVLSVCACCLFGDRTSRHRQACCFFLWRTKMLACVCVILLFGDTGRHAVFVENNSATSVGHDGMYVCVCTVRTKEAGRGTSAKGT